MNSRRLEHRAQHRGNVAVAALKRARHGLNEARGRFVGDEIRRELARDEARALRLLHEQIDRAFDFVEAATADRLAEKHMVVEVVAVRIELEQALAQDEILSARPDLRRLVIGVYADAREDVREFLHVLLRVAGVDAERVQLHEFARVVLVDLVRARSARCRDTAASPDA